MMKVQCERKLGDVDGSKKIDINDALEVLKYLARLTSILWNLETEEIKNVCAWNAALIDYRSKINGLVTIDDALEILKKLALLSNQIDTPEQGGE